MLPNHHITKPVFIGEIKADGQFDVVWKTDGPGARRRLVRRTSTARKDLEADWVKLKCGNYNTMTKKCGGQDSSYASRSACEVGGSRRLHASSSS